MGRSALILVMMLGAVFGIIGININSTNSEIVQSQANYANYSFARNLARIGVHRTLRACDKNDSLYIPPAAGIFYNGYYDILFKRTLDTVWITSTGKYSDTSKSENRYTMNIKLMRVTRPFPSAYGSVGISAPLQSISFSGKPKIDGTNHDINGNVIAGGAQPGIAVLSSADSAIVAAAGGTITGNPAIGVSPNQQDPAEYMSDYASLADKSFDQTHPPTKGDCGTIADPKIVVCNAGLDTNQTVTFPGGFSGSGILIINGKVKIPGNFSWNGLIIFSGINNIVDVDPAGNFNVVGGMILAGTGASLSLRGTSTNVLYSSAALDNTKKNVAQLQFYDIIEWYE